MVLLLSSLVQPAIGGCSLVPCPSVVEVAVVPSCCVGLNPIMVSASMVGSSQSAGSPMGGALFFVARCLRSILNVNVVVPVQWNGIPRVAFGKRQSSRNTMRLLCGCSSIRMGVVRASWKSCASAWSSTIGT